MKPLTLAITALALGALAPRTAAAQGLDVSIDLGGGSALAWEDPAQIGNLFGIGAFIGVDAFEVGIAGAVVLPDSRVQGDFGAVWAEGRWFPLEREGLWAPWVAVGFGVALEDGLTRRTVDAIDPVRWVTDSPSGLAVLGVGLRYGRREGLHLSVDVRAYNHSHGGLNVLVGYTF